MFWNLIFAKLASLCLCTAGAIPLLQEDIPLVPHQGQEVGQSAVQSEAQDEPKSQDEDPVVETVEKTAAGNPREIRLHLWDGNIITGELSISHLVVKTEFGDLKVPVDKIVSFRPGLQSYPQMREQITRLVTELGADDFKLRESAHKSLLAMGLQLRREIYRFEDGGNAERKRHLDEIRKEIESMIEDLDEDPEFADQSTAELIESDTLATRDFVIVGKISQDSFEVSSKYGPLTVQLADVRLADRQQSANVQRRTTLSVAGKNYIQSNPKSTGIRVNRGDRISIRAEGQITMSPWGNQASATPDGNLQYGNFEGNGGGTLMAQIGDEAKYIKAGSKATIVATKSGLLKLGIAMQPEYANESYQYPGSYKVKIVVDSATDND